MEFDGESEVDDESCDSYDTDEDPDAYVNEQNSSDENITTNSGFTSISDEEGTPISIF